MKDMFRSILILFLSAFFITPTFSQSEDKQINKLTFDMVDKEYEDVVYRAEKLRTETEYRKNPWVYLYMSQAYYRIAQDPQYMEEYSRAFKESLKAAYKLYKYTDESDLNLKVYQDHQAFLTELKDSAITLSEIYYDNEDPRKAAYYLDRVTRFDEDDYAIWLMKGVYEIRSRNIGEGVKSIKMAMENINESYVPDEVSAQTLVDALQEYALIIKAGEYNQYFEAYKFEVNEGQVPELIAMSENFKKYIVGDVVEVEDRKEESKIIYKSFRSEDKEESPEDEAEMED